MTLALFLVELQEEKYRLILTFIWISAAVFVGMVAVAFANLTLVYLFWDSARVFALGFLTAVYAGAAVAIIQAFRCYIARQPSPFSATRVELKKDSAYIRHDS
jgi:uncharacterized membrane protein YqjE